MPAYEIIDRPERDELGEGPVWDVGEQALYWVDIVEKRIFRLDPATGAIRRWTAPSMVSLAAVSAEEDLIVTLEDGVYRMDLATDTFARFAQPDQEARNRSNDSKADMAGNLLLGTMFNTTRPDKQPLEMPGRLGGLFRVRPDGSSERLLDDIGIPNALALTADGSTLTFADTTREVIWAFDYTPEGPLENRRVLLEGGPGHPDGAAMDVDGCLWNARWGAGVVVRITPDGRIDRTIELPVEQPSCCAFGGADMKTLYVTSARQQLPHLSPEAPDGALFAVQLDVAGVPTRRFGS